MKWSRLDSDGTNFYTTEVGDTGIWIDVWPAAKQWKVQLTNTQVLTEGPVLYRTLREAKAAGVELARQYLTALFYDALEGLK